MSGKEKGEMNENGKDLRGALSEEVAAAVADKVVEYAERNDHLGGVTFVEMERVIAAEGIETEGGYAFEVPDCPNLILWAGMSPEFCNVVYALMQGRKLDMAPADPLTYIIDGKSLRMPIARKPPKNGYKRERWLPVCFRLKEKKGGRDQ